MSKQLPKPEKPEEVDLIFIFSAFEKLFNKIGIVLSKIISFLSFLIKKVFIFLLFSINLIRRNYIIVILSFLIGFAVFYFLNKPDTTIYSSNMLLKQNFQTGKVLYRNISTFNSLASNQDSVALAKELGIPISTAAKIRGFSIAHSANRNLLLTDYFEFQKQTDSTTKITYDDYINYKDLEDFPLQTIYISSEDPNVYENLSKSVVNSILKNEYLEKLKNTELEAIVRKKNLLSTLVTESDTLQSSYFKLLKNYYGLKDQKTDKSNNSTINLNLDNQKEKINTKEYDLFKDSKSLKMQINEIEDELKQKETVFIVQKDFASPYILKDDYLNEVFYLTILFVLLVLSILLIRELAIVKLIDKYGTREKLFKKYDKQ